MSIGEPTLVCSPRAHRITLTVRPSGEVRLTYPRFVARERALAFYEEKRAWVERARQRAAERQRALPQGSEEEQHAEIERLRRLAKEDLPPRLERLSAASGLRYTHLTITSARTKWGSCSSKNRLSLSLFLMQLPEHLRDFVILHELCHTVHHNHSPRFHALLDHLVGGREKELNRELRSYSIR